MRASGGFTIIELVLVIVILSLLVSIAVVKFGGVTEEAEKAVCYAQLSTIKTALMNYYAHTAATEVTPHYPPSLTDPSFVNNYFADETLPDCLVGSTWIYNSTSGGVYRHGISKPPKKPKKDKDKDKDKD